MQKILFAFIALIITNAAQAQVYVQTTLPTVGLVQKTQLWNLVVVNGTTAPLEGKLELTLRDRQSGTELFTAATNRFSLPKGALSVNINNLSPVQYNYLGMQPDQAWNGLLPPGAYIACYSFINLSDGKQQPIAEECASFDAEPLSPPMLLFPADSAELEESPAQFTWTPPTPAGMFGRLRYEILITEIRPGQKAAEAVQENTGFYNSAGIANNFLTYPASLPAFEKNKWYSWQVVATDGNNYAGKSEVWTFKIKEPVSAASIVEMTPFVKLKTENPDLTVAPDGFLKIAYYNETGDTQAVVEVTNLNGQPASKNNNFFTAPLKAGENLIQYNLKKITGTPSEENVYMATLKNSRGESWSVRFVIRFIDHKK